MRPLAREADILVVGDDPDLRHSLTYLLEEQRHVVATAAHAAQALGYLRQHRPPCLILLGLALSAKEGWQLLAARHHDPTLGNIPVVALSTTGPSVRCLALALGADDFLEKPLNTEDLLTVVGRYCGRPECAKGWQIRVA